MPPSEELPNKPLIEAIFELRWGADGAGAAEVGTQDGSYRLVPGRYFDLIRSEYPVFEELPAAQVPPEIVRGLVQYRFRAVEGGWPLAQLGPGVLTVNDTDSYRWADFHPRCLRAVEAYHSIDPAVDADQELQVILRYIDAVEIGEEDPGAFMERLLRVKAELPAELFADGRVQPAAGNILFAWTFVLADGDELSIKFSTGTVKGQRAIVWETQATGRIVGRSFLAEWLETWHALLSDWFFTLTEGELLERFRA